MGAVLPLCCDVALQRSARQPSPRCSSASSSEGSPGGWRRRTGRCLTQDFTSRFELGEVVGTGHTSVVRRARCRDSGQMRAVKTLSAKSTDLEQLRNELDIQGLLGQHPHIVRLCESFCTTESHYVVMDLCAGGDLQQQLEARGKLPEAEAAIVMCCMLNALAFVHGRCVVHRDVKPENLLLALEGPLGQENVVRLCDFGCAARCGPGDPGLRELIGTPFYVAPQVVLRQYDRACDLWSAGVVLFALLSGQLPLVGATDEETLDLVRRGNAHLDEGFWSTVSDAARELLRRLLTWSAAERITAEEASHHRWLAAAGVAAPPVGAGGMPYPPVLQLPGIKLRRVYPGAASAKATKPQPAGAEQPQPMQPQPSQPVPPLPARAPVIAARVVDSPGARVVRAAAAPAASAQVVSPGAIVSLAGAPSPTTLCVLRLSRAVPS